MAGLIVAGPLPLAASTYVYLLDVPDYNWEWGCFGTATGNLAGYWDRNGFPDFYTGPTANGVAPLTDATTNSGIHALWASQAGVDGRPTSQPGHVDDYYVNYESTAPDPYVIAGRAEHAPDCLGDFIGLSQNRWTSMNGECDGNLDGFSFVFWDTNGARRVNFSPTNDAGSPVHDIPSGLREWTRSRGSEADVFSQLTDFNPNVPAGQGFTFADLKAEIDAGYPVLLFLQGYTANSRTVGDKTNANPLIHGMLAYGYQEDPTYGTEWVYYRTSWASGSGVHSQWNANHWQAGMPVRGVIGYHPKPLLRGIARTNGTVTLTWDGPSPRIYDAIAHTTGYVHTYQAEWTPSLTPAGWKAIGDATWDHTITFPEPVAEAAFYHVRLLGP